METKTLKDLLNYMGIFGRKTATQMKMESGNYKTYSYDDMVHQAKAVAAYLEKVKHLKKEDMVALHSENRPEWMMAYFGIVYNGIWAVPLDARLSDLEVKNLVLDCGTRILFVSKALYENLSGEPEIMKHIQEFIIFDDIEGTELAKDKKIKSFRQVIEEGAMHELKEREVKPEDVASLIYTSGTTGTPKGVMLTHANFAHQFNALSKAITITPEDTILSILPLHHTFQFSVEITVFFCGGAMTYAESFKPNKMLANIKETGVTIMVGVPLLFEKIYDGIMRNIRSLPIGVKHIIMGLYHFTSALNKVTHNKAGRSIMGFIRKKANMATVRFMISGAAPLNYKVAKGFETLGFSLLNGYGLTETSPVISVNPFNNPKKPAKNESVGLIVEDVQVKIDNPDSIGNGEILVRGPNLMKGYYNNVKATKEAIDSDGWLHTGDIGKLDNEGYLYVTGRKKNIIVTAGGKNVYPEEIEELLNNSPYILESLIVGVPEGAHSKGENIYCYVVPNYEYFDTYGSIQGLKITDEFVEKTVEQTVREINTKLADYKKIKGWRIRREEFQKTSTKKIKRYLFSGKDFLES